MSYNGLVDVADQRLLSILLNPSCIDAESVTKKRNAKIIWLSQAYFVNALYLSVEGENKDNICWSYSQSHVQVLRSSREPCGNGCIGLWWVGESTWHHSLAPCTEDGEKGGITVWIICWRWGSTSYTSGKSCSPLQENECPTQSTITQPFSCKIFWWHCIWMQCFFVLSYWWRLHFEYGTYSFGWERLLHLDDDVVVYFCFPTLGVAVPMRPGDFLLFNSQIPHCISTRCRIADRIMCISMFLKTAVVGSNNNSLPVTPVQHRLCVKYCDVDGLKPL